MFQQCQDFVAKYITDIARTSAFLFLTPAELAGILAIHSIDLASDSVLFDSLLHWFQHDPTARQRHLYKLYHGKSAPPVLTHLPLTATPPDPLTPPPVSPVMCIQNPYYNYSYATGGTAAANAGMCMQQHQHQPLAHKSPTACYSYPCGTQNFSSQNFSSSSNYATAAYMSHGGVTQRNFRQTAFGSHGLLTLNPRFPGVPLMAGGYHSSPQQQQQHQLTSSLPLSPPSSADPPFAVNSGGFHVPVLRTTLLATNPYFPSGVTPSPPFMSPAFSGAYEGNSRPPYSYSALIAMAILSSSKKMLTLPDIYDFYL